MSKINKNLLIFTIIFTISGSFWLPAGANMADSTTRVYGEIYDMYGNKLQESIPVYFVQVDNNGSRIADKKMI